MSDVLKQAFGTVSGRFPKNAKKARKVAKRRNPVSKRRAGTGIPSAYGQELPIQGQGY